MDITVDESLYYPRARDSKNDCVKVSKNCSTHVKKNGKDIDNHTEHPDPFLLSDTKVMTGQGKAIVCCVGENTVLARNRGP
jgi:magnesium-transporting ATPase (P-type)